MATKANEKAEGDVADAPQADSPLLDLSDPAVKRMIKLAKKRGYVTYDELNEVLPSEEVTSEQIEDISPCSTRWASTSSSPRRPTPIAPRPRRRRGGRGRGRRARRGRAATAVGQGGTRRADRPHRRPGAHVSARDGLGRAAVARGRNRHRQAHRGRPRDDDRGPLREPADLPGHHHLARRAERRQGPAARHHRPRGHLCRPRGQGRPEAAEGEEEERRARVAPPARARRATAPRRPSPRATSRKTTWRTTSPCRPWKPS